MTTNLDILIIEVKGLDMPTIKMYTSLAHEEAHPKISKVHLSSKISKLKTKIKLKIE